MLFSLFSVVFFSLLSHSLVQAIPSVSFFYPKSLAESTCVDLHSWTKWFNSAKPMHAKDFDIENLSTIQATNGRDVCRVPQGIQARTVSALQTNVSYAAAWKATNGTIAAFISRTAGVDFEVRFCCPTGEFIATTTSAPRPLDSKTCGRSQIEPSFRSTRIFGGSSAIPNSWPWQVLFEEQKPCETNRTCIDTCGGTLIDKHHVLTAAHCIRGEELKKILITAGVHNRQNDRLNTRQERRVDSIFLHPDWNSETSTNDLAILRLSSPVQFNKYVQPACLPGPDPQAHSEVVLIGWGAERMGGSPNDELKQTRVKVISECQKYWHLFDEEIQICAGQTISGDSACQGDSGGPLLQQFNGQWIVQGVASFIDHCRTDANLPPNVYVRVSAYLDWIRSVLQG